MDINKVKCPCCDNYTIDGVITDICPVCFWQYDEFCHDKPEFPGGANHLSLSEAKSNYLKYRVSDIRFTNNVRLPKREELPENNK